MAKYLEKVRKNLEKFDYFKIEQILREQNSNNDALAKLASQNDLDELNLVPVEMLNEPSICEEEDVEMIDSLLTWMTPIINYLLNGKFPTDKNEARKLLYSVPRYMIVDDKLYRRGYSMPILQCVLPAEANKIIGEIHEGFCGDQSELRMMTLPYPFAIWGIDLIGGLPTRRGGDKYAVVAIDFFTIGPRPQANGQVEAANKTLKDTIKKKLDVGKGRWVDELPQVLWAHRTTEKTTMRYTPFSKPTPSNKILQQKGEKEAFQHWRIGAKASVYKYERHICKSIQPKLGGSLCDQSGSRNQGLQIGSAKWLADKELLETEIFAILLLLN
ncbi:hypothetical protein CsatB_026756 [Cannabis sativa]